MDKPVAWSYSRLSSYETCPKKYHAETIAKSVPWVQSEQAAYGELVHKAFELFLKKQTPLPLNLKHWTPVLSQFANAPGEKLVEQQITFNVNYEPTEWMARDAWLRVKSDLTIINGTQAVIMDWKTGRQRDEDGMQLKLAAAVTFLLDPNITEINMNYLWVQTKTITPFRMKSDQVADFWGNILPRVQRLQAAHDGNNFPARPNYLCRGWCGVKTCEFYEPRK